MNIRQALAPADAERKARVAKWRKRLEEIKARVASQGKPKLSEAEASRLIARARTEVREERALGRVPSTGLQHLAERSSAESNDSAAGLSETHASTEMTGSTTVGSAGRDPSEFQRPALKSGSKAELVWARTGPQSAKGWPAIILDITDESATIELYSADGNLIENRRIPLKAVGEEQAWELVPFESLTAVPGLQKGTSALQDRDGGGYQIVQLEHDVGTAKVTSVRFYHYADYGQLVGGTAAAPVSSLHAASDVARAIKNSKA
jgi:hypothetical protein